MVAGITIFAQGSNNNSSTVLTTKKINAPDLVINKYSFLDTNKKAVRVFVYNQGKSAAGVNRLQILVSKINGVTVQRKRAITVPALDNGKGVWLFLNAKSILPNDVALDSTFFRLTVDATNVIEESGESNNDVYYTGENKLVVPSDIGSLTPELSAAAPDLRIRQISFEEDNKKVKVQVYNGGNADAVATMFLLRIGKINGTKVNRKKSYKMPPLGKQKAVWITLDANSLLPDSVSLKSTFFRVSVDIPDIINEPDEKNNHYYHKP